MTGKLLPLLHPTLRRADTVVIAEGGAATAATNNSPFDDVPSPSLTSTGELGSPLIAALTLEQRISLLMLHTAPLQGLRC